MAGFVTALHNGLPVNQTLYFVRSLADENAYNPVAEWIDSVPWDGIDRLPSLYATVVTREGYPASLKETLLYRWLMSAVAAALMIFGFYNRGVLTFQGPQSRGKTSWIRSLIPDLALAHLAIKIDHHLDGGNKDSIIGAIRHWIVEIGELDSSLKKDIARLKGVLTSNTDKQRLPYARAESDYPRRTVFCATVNEHNFLVDNTGNSRWWTIAIDHLNYNHGIDMQQLFAQLAVAFRAGEQWWLTASEEDALNAYNRQHQSVSVIREQILDYLDLSRKDASGLRAMTCMEALRAAGIAHPTNPQTKECGAILRELLGAPKRIQGRDKWRIPEHQTRPAPPSAYADDDDY